jgi:outer membrane protein
LQYHFSPDSKISPYVGAGELHLFLDEKLKDGGKLKLSSSVGLAAQVGVDIRVNPQWTVGADIRYADIDTDVKINNVNVGNVDVNPTIYSLNVGYRF